MSYPSNPLLPKARAEAIRLVTEHKLPVAIAAWKSGYSPHHVVALDTGVARRQRERAARQPQPILTYM